MASCSARQFSPSLRAEAGARSPRRGVEHDPEAGYGLSLVAIPTYDQFVWPLLKLLGEHRDGIRSSDVYKALAERVGLSEEEQQELLPSGRQAIFHNRIGWAHDRLKRAGYSEAIRRGLWGLTSKGRDFLSAHPNGLTDDELEKIVKVPADSRLRDPEEEDAGVDATSTDEAPERQSPEERVDAAVREIHESLSAELLDLIGRSSPAFFEQLVLDLLVAMGYGASRKSLQHTGRSGDGGIDGIISLDRLGLEKVYVQAKRWQNSVGSPEIQAFFGALAGRRANKGVFITTSAFTRDAREYARQVSDSLVLIDGALLTALMIEHGVGVSVDRTITIASADTDYFEEA